MSDDVNTTTVSGRLTRNPEVRVTPSGSSVMDFSIACNRYKEGKQTTEYFKTTLWNKAADWFSTRLNRGDHVLITGRLVDDNFPQSDGTQTSGRLKIENPHINILNKAEAVTEVSALEVPPVPEV